MGWTVRKGVIPVGFCTHFIFAILVTGRKAVLTIYEDDVQKEEVHLFSLKTKEELHAMFQEKGFKKKGQEAINEDMRIRNVETQLAQIEQMKPIMSNIFVVYGVVGIVALIGVVVLQTRARKQRRSLFPVRV